ncbi:FAD-dependent oxidoreductase [Thermobifida alba]|uniref:FAD-dependent oxidoreductase n=1 Tax=Thermobifida alba TaxID=53522 RepID=A0ABY4L6T7_THEAE|nr:FAD-dependent oxidoreductase [Thermobifida alba]UPT22085.1 FAD-dependent oxidoreductase [Thermobifida alba]
MDEDPLFTPLEVAGVHLRNRIVMAPMGTGLERDGHITDAVVAYYRRRAAGGVGAVTVEALLVDPATRGPEPHIHSRAYLPGLARLAEAIRAEGAAAGAQLMHPGRQVLTGRRVGPSPVPLNSVSPVPDALSTTEIAEIVDYFAEGAALAQEAGFDYVEVHGAHGYLVSDFLSPLANQRDDAYGGSLANRARFAREVARAIRARCPDLPLFYRLSGEEALPGGTTVDDAVTVARWLEEDGVACLSISSGTWKSLHTTIPPMWVPRGQLVPLAARVRQAVSVPVISVGRLHDPASARRALREGAADLVAIGRGLIADPDWANKVAAGREADVRPCISCNACVDQVGPGGEVVCTVNPAIGREEDWAVRPAARSRRVVVVGGGPAGMEAARTARQRGHRVLLLERSPRVGGKLAVAASAPSKHEVFRFRDWQEQELRRLGVEVRTGVDATPELLRAEKPDAVILATGAAPLLPPIPGLDLPHVHDAQEYLNGRRPVAAGSPVAVLGGGATGCETAELLVEAGAKVTVVEMASSVGRGIEAITRRYLIKQLRKRGVEFVTGARVVRVGPGEVVYESNGEEHSLAAEHVAVALGWRSRAADLVDALAGHEVHVVGDADRPADFVAAVRSGAEAGLAV